MKDVVEVKIGYDGIVLAESVAATGLKLGLRDVYLALAKQVPDPTGKQVLVANPYKTWKDVNPQLPATVIEVLGPPPTSGTRDAFVELAMEGGCKTVPWIKAIKDQDESRFKQVCHTIREDGRFIEAGENDNLIVQKLKANPKAVGIFGYSFLEQNSDVGEGFSDRRRRADFREHRERQVSGFAAAVLLRQEGTHRLDSRNHRIPGGIHQPQGDG